MSPIVQQGRMSLMRCNRSTKLVCAIVAIAAYFLAAYWLKTIYVPLDFSHAEPTVSGTKILLHRPFVRFLNSDFAVVVQDDLFANLADSADDKQRSTIEIFEDETRIGPAHSTHADVAKIGHGRFSHWRNADGSTFAFSSTDNTDPQTNRRAYWVVKPDIP